MRKRSILYAAIFSILIAATYLIFYGDYGGNVSRPLSETSISPKGPTESPAILATVEKISQSESPQVQNIDRSEILDGNSPVLLATIYGIFTLIAIAMILTYMSWRIKKLIASPHIITPQSFENLVNEIAKHLNVVSDTVVSARTAIDNQRSEAQSSVKDIHKSFLTMQSALDLRDAQIKRAEDGWEQSVYLRFVRRFAKIDEMLNENPPPTLETTLLNTKLLLWDALEESGVEKYYPEIGADFRKEAAAGESPIKIETEDASLAYKIVEVIRPGYRLTEVSNSAKSTIIPAEVKIYIYKERLNG